MESWRSKRNRLVRLIKEVSDGYGGDDRDWLIGYCREVIAAYKDKMDVAIDAFTLLAGQVRPIRMQHDDGMEPKEAGRAEGAV